MNNAAYVQVKTGPTSSIVQHGAALVQEWSGLSGEWCLVLVMFGGLCAVVGASAATVSGAAWLKGRLQRGVYL